MLRVFTLALLLALAAAPAAARQQEQSIAVAMQRVAFEPTMLTIPAGSTVAWTNYDPFEHTVTADDGSFDSGYLGQGQTFSLTFTQPGTYPYFCIPHGGPGGVGMAGVVVVTGEPQPRVETPQPEAEPPQPTADTLPPEPVTFEPEAETPQTEVEPIP